MWDPVSDWIQTRTPPTDITKPDWESLHGVDACTLTAVGSLEAGSSCFLERGLMASLLPRPLQAICLPSFINIGSVCVSLFFFLILYQIPKAK
jgi:hypothetical protein